MISRPLAAAQPVHFDAGMTQTQSIIASPNSGLAGKTGAIQTGFEADLIVVERNPLQDVRALADVLVVISNGRVALNRLPFAR